MMVTNPPYTSWALHAKLFTAEAVKLWDSLNKDPSVPPLPRGFTTQVELEGVDGKSGVPGSGRTGPLDVSDSKYLCMFRIRMSLMDYSRIHNISSCQTPRCCSRKESYLCSMSDFD